MGVPWCSGGRAGPLAAVRRARGSAPAPGRGVSDRTRRRRVRAATARTARGRRPRCGSTRRTPTRRCGRCRGQRRTHDTIVRCLERERQPDVRDAGDRPKMSGRPVLPPSPAALPGELRAQVTEVSARTRRIALRGRGPPGRGCPRVPDAARAVLAGPSCPRVRPVLSLGRTSGSTVGSPYSGTPTVGAAVPVSCLHPPPHPREPVSDAYSSPPSARPPSAAPRSGSPACPARASRPSRTAARPSCAPAACASRSSTATPSVRTSPRPAATPARTAPSTSDGSAGSPSCSPATASSSWSRRSRRSATSATRSGRRTRPTARSTWRCTSAPPWRWRRSATSRVSTPASAWARSPG